MREKWRLLVKNRKEAKETGTRPHKRKITELLQSFDPTTFQATQLHHRYAGLKASSMNYSGDNS